MEHQDSIALDAGEEKAVELKHEMVAGQERVLWNPALSLPAREFEFSDAEVARIKAAVESWDAYGANAIVVGSNLCLAVYRRCCEMIR